MTVIPRALDRNHPVERLRRLAGLLEAIVQRAPSSDELSQDCAWLAHAIRTYEAGATGGVELTEALGLTRYAGEKGWWRAEAQHLRNAHLKEARQTYFADLSLHAAAAEIVALAKRQEHRSRPTKEGPALLIHDAMQILPVPGTPKQVQAILEIK